MSADAVDDLHEAEDHIGALYAAIERYRAVSEEEREDPDDWDTRAEYIAWLQRMIEVETALYALVDTYERPSCDEDCADDCCGSPRHYNQDWDDDSGQWVDIYPDAGERT